MTGILVFTLLDDIFEDERKPIGWSVVHVEAHCQSTFLKDGRERRYVVNFLKILRIKQNSGQAQGDLGLYVLHLGSLERARGYLVRSKES